MATMIITATLLIETALFIYGRSAGHIGASTSTRSKGRAMVSYKGTITGNHTYNVI